MCDCKNNDKYGDHLPTLIIWESLDLKPSGRLEETSQLVLLHINLDHDSDIDGDDDDGHGESAPGLDTCNWAAAEDGGTQHPARCHQHQHRFHHYHLYHGHHCHHCWCPLPRLSPLSSIIMMYHQLSKSPWDIWQCYELGELLEVERTHPEISSQSHNHSTTSDISNHLHRGNTEITEFPVSFVLFTQMICDIWKFVGNKIIASLSTWKNFEHTERTSLWACKRKILNWLRLATNTATYN